MSFFVAGAVVKKVNYVQNFYETRYPFEVKTVCNLTTTLLDKGVLY